MSESDSRDLHADWVDAYGLQPIEDIDPIEKFGRRAVRRAAIGAAVGGAAIAGGRRRRRNSRPAIGRAPRALGPGPRALGR